ncbi:MAG: hypothetical protein SGI71_11455 [Verrucomicrobiota bacterium]|nr:hypothetical protein [Verrucomicrobiota bacterium]
MKDRSITLLALLSANDRLGQPSIHRTTLVKQAFLAETIRPLYRIWLQMFAFFRYNHGPYSDDIFERIDTLVFSGLVEVESYQRRGGRTEARYKISEAGNRLLDEIGPQEIKILATDLIWGLQSIGVEQAGSICKLVYQEAEFARIFSQHTAQGIGPETRVPLPSVTAANNETFITLASLQGFQNRRHAELASESLPSREIVRMFLLSLALQVPIVRRTEMASS